MVFFIQYLYSNHGVHKQNRIYTNFCLQLESKCDDESSLSTFIFKFSETEQWSTISKVQKRYKTLSYTIDFAMFNLAWTHPTEAEKFCYTVFPEND